MTIVFLVYNRRDELRTSLRKMLFESSYEGAVDVIVVDNASTDGSADMVRSEFPDVRLIVRDTNVGVSGWNDGLAVAQGDWVLMLDDDCYLPADGLGHAIAAAGEHEADLVSFKVESTREPGYFFTTEYRTGLFTFWGCAVLVRGAALRELGGYDPEIFVWANELEFTMRLLDRGYRHLHLPEVVAQHMKAPLRGVTYQTADMRPYRINARHFAYIAAKLLAPRDAVEALIALLAQNVRDGFREHRGRFTAIPQTIAGFVHGLRHRAPLRKRELSHFYRQHFESFASPWWTSRPIRELIRSLPRELADREFHHTKRPRDVGRWDEFFEQREALYPDEARVVQF